jgi:hypothetical protein
MSDDPNTVCVDKNMLKEYVINYGNRQFQDGFMLGFVQGLLLGASFATIAYLFVKQK